MRSKVEPTKEQQEIIDKEGNIVITAKPGSGKTFTIVEKIKSIADNLLDYEGVIAISFTRRASYELEVRCKRREIPKKCSFYGTLDKFYITQIIMPFAKHITQNIVALEVKDKLNEYPQYKDLIQLKQGKNILLEELLIQSLDEGYIFLEICGETAKYILENVPDCKKYLKARYTHIFIDEYQDCGEVQHQIFMQLVELGIIGVAVGDLDQAIYAFSDRYSKYLELLITAKKFTHLQLTHNHRCHKSISDYSLRLMGENIEEDSEDTRVFAVSVQGHEKELMVQIHKRLEEIKKHFNVKNNNEIAILCRSNASAQIMDKYLQTKHKLFLENELDRYSSYWARFCNDLLGCYFDSDVCAIDFCQRYIDEEIDSKSFTKLNLIVNKIFGLCTEELSGNVAMFFEAARIVYPEYENKEIKEVVQDIVSNIEILNNYKPASADEVCILTLHKSKGLEYKIVFHMDLYKWIFPREGNNVSEEEQVQSLNLHYVGVTRAMDACFLMQGTQRYRPSNNDLYKAEASPLMYKNNLIQFRRNIKW